MKKNEAQVLNKLRIAMAATFEIDVEKADHIRTTASNEVKLIGVGTDEEDLYALQERISKVVTEYFRDKELGQ